MKILVITNLFPNNLEPTRGIFNSQQIKHLADSSDVELKVVAPLPWYYRRGISKEENIEGISVTHPRYFMFPKLGRSLYGYFFYRSLRNIVKQIYSNFSFDVIFATWVYPDGYGSYLIAKEIDKPIVIKAHGSDINEYINYPLRKKMIASALNYSKKVVAVSKGLKEKIINIGVPAEKVVVLYNGIDRQLFRPLDQEKCRKDMNLPLGKKVFLYAGNFVMGKGIEYLIEAFSKSFAHSNEYLLLLVGSGNLKKNLKQRTDKLGLLDKILFIDRLPHEKIPLIMNACDIFCLPSLNEGCPNVVLEAMACGKPVVGSNVGGIPELITSTELGILAKPADSESLSSALKEAINKRWDSGTIINSVKKFNWEENVSQLKKVLEEAI